MKNKIILIVASIIIFLVCFVTIAKANPSSIPPGVKSSTATTSPIWLTTSTSHTLTYDSFANGSTQKADQAVLLTQFAASSTSSNLSIAVSYSQDGIDWYNDNLLTANATTSQTIAIQATTTYSWIANGTATSSKAILVETPTRFVRVIYSISGAAGNVWGWIVPRKEINN